MSTSEKEELRCFEEKLRHEHNELYKRVERLEAQATKSADEAKRLTTEAERLTAEATQLHKSPLVCSACCLIRRRKPPSEEELMAWRKWNNIDNDAKTMTAKAKSANINAIIDAEEANSAKESLRLKESFMLSYVKSACGYE